MHFIHLSTASIWIYANIRTHSIVEELLIQIVSVLQLMSLRGAKRPHVNQLEPTVRNSEPALPISEKGNVHWNMSHQYFTTKLHELLLLFYVWKTE